MWSQMPPTCITTCGIHQLSYVGMNAVEFSFTNRRTRGLDVEYQMYVEFT